MTEIKICGLRTADHALAAAEAGATMLGFIFAPARRQVQPREVAAIGQALRASGLPLPQLVGVFVNTSAEQMLAQARACGLGALQLSGDEPVALAEQLAGLPVLKAIRFDGSAAEQDWIDCELPNVRLVVDAHVPGAYGGAGVTADWDAARALAARRPIVLAGGLSPANVADAIRHVQPWGVDVSSGVETDGVKDIAKIRAFAHAARAVFSEPSP